MRRSLWAGALAAVAMAVTMAGPVLAHGDHDARPLVRNVSVGPYTISLWQVYADSATAMTPHLIVMFDDGPAAAAEARVEVSVNGAPVHTMPSATTRNGWETMDGTSTNDVVQVAITKGDASWTMDPLTIPPPPMSVLPVQELLWASIFLTFATIVWLGRRATRAWRRPAVTVA